MTAGDDPDESPTDGEASEDDALSDAPVGEAVQEVDQARDDRADLRARGERALTWILGLALVLALAGVVYVAMVPPETTDPYTEFYLLNESGAASGYPTQLAPGETDTVIVGLSNHEQRDVTYRVVVTWNGTETVERSVSVGDGETEERRVALTAPDEPGRYRVRFLLFNETGSEPYLRNRLWIEVREPNASANQ